MRGWRHDWRRFPYAEKRGELFCALPVRAMSDDRLSARHFRLMAAIAWHDRLNHTGRGCYAKPGTLRKEAKIHATDFADLLRDLEQFGFARIDRTFGRRVRTIHLIYSAQLGASTKSCVDVVAASAQLGASPNLPAEELGVPEAPTSEIIEESDNNICSETKIIIDAVKLTQMHPSGRGVGERVPVTPITRSFLVASQEHDCLQWGDVVPKLAVLTGISHEDASGALAAMTHQTYLALAARDLPDDERRAMFLAETRKLVAA